MIRLILIPDPNKRPSIQKICQILDEWEELDNIPLNDVAFNIKQKHLEIID